MSTNEPKTLRDYLEILKQHPQFIDRIKTKEPNIDELRSATIEKITVEHQ